MPRGIDATNKTPLHIVLLALLPILGLVADPDRVLAQDDLGGTWDVELISPVGPFEFPVQVEQDGGALVVSAPPGPDAQPIFEGTIEEAAVYFEFETEYEGTPIFIILTGTASNDQMGGNANYGGMADGTWRATRAD